MFVHLLQASVIEEQTKVLGKQTINSAISLPYLQSTHLRYWNNFKFVSFEL